MEFLQLYYFNLVAKCEHMTSAAAQLHIAQPALTQTIRRLEQELGVPLFDHEGRRIRLNQYGKILYQYSEQILQAVDNAKTEIDDVRQEAERTVSAAFMAASSLLPEIVEQFYRKFPVIHLNIVQSLSGSGTHGNEDMTIFSAAEDQVTSEAILLLKEPLLAALPSGHRMACAASVALSDLKDESFISMGPETSLGSMTVNYCRQAGFEPKIALMCENPAIFRELLAYNLGIALIPQKTWRMKDSSSFVLKPISDLKCNRYVCLKMHKGKYESTAVRTLKDFLIQFFSKL